MNLVNNADFGKQVDFDLAESGPFHRLLKESCICNDVTFYEKVPDEELTTLYKKAIVFLLPTLFEGLPAVILEAMSWCWPIIFTDFDTVTELVNESNGLIIEKGDKREV